MSVGVWIAVYGESGGKAGGLGQAAVLVIVVVVIVVVIIVVVAAPISVVILAPILGQQNVHIMNDVIL
jgi:predicted metalloprotease